MSEYRAVVLDALDFLESSATIKNNYFNVPEINTHNEQVYQRAELIRRALFAIPAPIGATREEAWQPIETAPKDGTHILAYRRPIGIRVTNMTNPPTVVHWFDDGFYTSINEMAPERPFNPTHWKPLDPPPPPITRPQQSPPENKGE